MYCAKCDKPQPEGNSICSNCGSVISQTNPISNLTPVNTPIPASPPAQEKVVRRRTSGLAIVSLVMGILWIPFFREITAENNHWIPSNWIPDDFGLLYGLFMFMCIWVLSIGALTSGWIALNQTRKETNVSGAPLAIVGMMLGILEFFPNIYFASKLLEIASM
jgi:hypothetical protein